ncbi:glycyl-radical enzyme activating protein [Olsenella sp. YH-ols2217]|uniref:Glycyl-radical enzyme activating protein n=1 Tax=Kribbibacterium absianum TaxID=3044210 RepID=A0ABT6ZK88_9ACTN|nr:MULTISPECIES: glycyl-radical enzyme activating protein [unclassified Olsenella]MDJ1122589.1 glycyl-radical enzyme activating protein [Olsenella sp. YH-ols2216]MDJ1129451.1 glycyl-radical enzyme activating protein [Olsenella sp. YH-ols2217]
METPSATVFNVQKFSLDDGPGIRTTVFLKGCPLRCAWCANPESQLGAPQVLWDRRQCVGCGTCAAGSGAVTLDEKGVHVDHARVKDAEAVAGLCPHGALTVAGETRTADDVAEECLQDLPFYQESGGGVTVSGGEPLLWPDFVEALAARMHGHGVPMAVETTGCVSEAAFARALESLDLVLFDVKHPNEAWHMDGTGVGLGLIRKNLVQALRWAEAGGEVLFRTPVIFGYNDGAAAGIAEMLHGAAREAGFSGTPRLQLLPLHQFGEGKYDKLGREYGLRDERPLHEEDLEPMAEELRALGIDAFV